MAMHRIQPLDTRSAWDKSYNLLPYEEQQVLRGEILRRLLATRRQRTEPLWTSHRLPEPELKAINAAHDHAHQNNPWFRLYPFFSRP
jgi:hypothetical protein